jgi:hypothetical protein
LQRAAERRRAEVLSMLLAVSRDVPVDASTQKALVAGGAGFDDALRGLQENVQQFAANQRALVEQQLSTVVAPLQKKLAEAQEAASAAAAHVAALERDVRAAQQQGEELRAQLVAARRENERQRAAFEEARARLEEALAQAQEDAQVLRHQAQLAEELTRVEAVAPFKAEAEALRESLRQQQTHHEEEVQSLQRAFEKELAQQRLKLEELLGLARQPTATNVSVAAAGGGSGSGSGSVGSSASSSGGGGGDDPPAREGGEGLDELRQRLLGSPVDSREFVALLERSIAPAAARGLSRASELHAATGALLERSREAGGRQVARALARAAGRR